MSGFRLAATMLAAAALVGGSAIGSTLRAQASGTLQASVMVLDDRVSRMVRERLADFEAEGGRQADRSGSGRVAGSRGITAKLIELDPIGAVRRVRLEVAYLD
jgi:hypothetical protein